MDVSESFMAAKQAVMNRPLTFRKLIQVLNGSGKEETNNQAFGKLASRSVWEIEQTVKEMIYLKILEEYSRCNNGKKGFVNVNIYLRYNMRSTYKNLTILKRESKKAKNVLSNQEDVGNVDSSDDHKFNPLTGEVVQPKFRNNKNAK